MNLQKSLPVITSILIILAVAALRDRSKLLATIFATMPINMPLALWVLSGSGPDDPALMAGYARAFLISLMPSVIWLVVVYLGLRGGWSLPGAILSGYAVWGLLMAGLFGLGILAVPR